MVALTEVFHLDHRISVQSAQEETRTLLDPFTEILAGLGSDGLPVWWWDPGIHRSDRLLQMMRVIDRVVLVIGLRHCGDVVRGDVEPCSIWRGRFSLTIQDRVYLRIGGFDITEMPWRDMI